GLDMYACTLAPGLMWIAAWVLYRRRENTWLALASALPIFILAIGLKEYAYGLVALGPLSALFFRRSEPIGTAMTVGGALGTVVAGLMFLRRFTKPDDAVAGGAVALPHLSVLNVPYNLGLLGGSLLTPISTSWLYTHRTEVAVLAAGAAGIG